MAEKNGVLSRCATCRFAKWERTVNGRRHPNGSGKCTFEFPDSPLPKWIHIRALGRGETPLLTRLSEVLAQRHGGRWIYWLDRHRTEPEPCATWQPIGDKGDTERGN